jgi:hypothetical protein
VVAGRLIAARALDAESGGCTEINRMTPLKGSARNGVANRESRQSPASWRPVRARAGGRAAELSLPYIRRSRLL